MFALDRNQQLSLPKWGKQLGWSVQDDAMLLLGGCSLRCIC